VIRSMTGFGRAAFELEGLAFNLEIRTVNHRHLDVRVKLPKFLADAEAELKGLVQRRLQRGKADASITLSGDAHAITRLEVDSEVAQQYVAAAEGLRQAGTVTGEIEISQLLALPGVTRFIEVGLPEDALKAAALTAMGSALDALDEMRLREGEALERDFQQRLARVLELVAAFEARSELVVEAVRERLRKRSEQLTRDTGLVDEARIHQEIVIAADRMDISEEIVRLKSHVDQFRAILGEADAGTSVGRRLDFLLQELGREANTVGSKAADAPLAHEVVELKTELERIREQVQNVE
jgi:uncharacterized protein (TIGR00255 family)